MKQYPVLFKPGQKNSPNPIPGMAKLLTETEIKSDKKAPAEVCRGFNMLYSLFSIT